MINENEKLISIDELIERAKNFGVDFGRGDPRNRLRYFVKIGIFPNAQRKTYKGLPSQGVYPESALKILLDIDKKLKAGKSILQIKRELEEQKEKTKQKNQSITLSEDILFKTSREEEKIFQKEKEKKKNFLFKNKEKKRILNFSFLSKVFLLTSVFLSIFFFKEKVGFEKTINLFLAAITNFKKIAQAPLSLPGKDTDLLSSFAFESFLTINAETVVNPKLRVSQSIASPIFVLESGNFSGNLITQGLTADRIYTFPDQSGVVCLSTGNCFSPTGEIRIGNSTVNRMIKFTGTRTIANASIVDLFSGVAMTIDTTGNVGIGTATPREKLEISGNLLAGRIFTDRIGIGTNNPLFPLHVFGQIQATGDICTDLAGGKCLSQIITSLPSPGYFGGGGGGGIRGIGQANYLPIWINRDTLGNSILYQAGGNIGINLTNPNEALTIAGVLSLTKSVEPGENAGFGKIFVGLDGRLYFKDELGTLYDLTRPFSVIGGGEPGQVAFWNSTSTVTGENEFFWDMENKRLGIGTILPTEKLDVVGTIKATGFQLTTDAQEGYVLTANALGIGTWRPAPTGTIPSGTFGQTLWYNGLSWVPTSFLSNTGSTVGIGTSTSVATLAVAGSGFFAGPLTIETPDLVKLILQSDDGNYMRFSINSTSSEIFSSNTLIFNSLTGELKFFETSLKRGDKILRSSIPIFKFPIPIETSSTTFVSITRQISTTTLNATLPPKLEGAQRKYAILANFADNIPQDVSSNWKIDFTSQPDFDFDFQGQSLSSLEEGVPHLKDNLTGLENDNWALKIKVPNSSYKLRIFNIFLLVYDQIQ